MRILKFVSLAFGAILLQNCSAPSDEGAKSSQVSNQPALERTGSADNNSYSAEQVVGTHSDPLLGLPPVPIPQNNPMSDDKIALGKKLFLDAQFSADGKVSCSTCHKLEKAFTDGPLQTSQGFMGKTGTRNAPTVVNAAFNESQFWDGRRADLEGQSMDPPVNPVEGGLPNHEPILDAIRQDSDYEKAFKQVFGKAGEDITMTEVSYAIAAFERTIVSGNSGFDQYYYGGNKAAMSPAAIRGLDVFLGQGRCVSCHTIEQDYAIFTDHKFHNLGIGFNRISQNIESVAGDLIANERAGHSVDDMVLSDPNASELGRFAINGEWQDIGQFKTPTLRNIAATAPYMHDGSLATLKEVVQFYNDTLVPGDKGPANPFQSGGIRPLNLSDEQQKDLVAYLESLTSPQYQDAVREE
ncbi:MAG TPA: c-type cytochrome [Hellea balneolensis]|uniref:C-type cytochrome n=1 Tax=Hellea balneolensis TaxID=287478 RepID=A0A7C3CCD2_9PROT|nr:c-type cytochrome [Hellea balneolensis]